jgi:hypothetical protein
MTPHHNDNMNFANVEPIHVLKAQLDFESDAWSTTESTSIDINTHGSPEAWNIWTDALDPARDLAAYHRLAISPFRLRDLLAVWRIGSRKSTTKNVIIDCEVDDALVDDALSVLRTLHRRTVDLVGKDTAEGLLVLDDDALDLYTRSFRIKELQMVRIEGPIDRGDIMAMLESATTGRSPMDTELRGISAVEYREKGPTILESREVNMVAAALATDIARYVESVLRVPHGGIPRPPESAVLRLLAKSGSILVRPQDTELLGTSVDVGICTSYGDELAKIDTTLVFCRPDGTWHAREAA